MGHEKGDLSVWSVEMRGVDGVVMGAGEVPLVLCTVRTAIATTVLTYIFTSSEHPKAKSTSS